MDPEWCGSCRFIVGWERSRSSELTFIRAGWISAVGRKRLDVQVSGEGADWR